ncbi:MAG: glycosyltransferase family 9 protein [Candidatus Aminicenantes bacterium]|nr:glycosyltransferase family 9 protein [Candidatus Aminicenantes bacterium]
MKNALLIRYGGLGDLLVALPSIRLLRAKFPGARLTLVSRKQYGELFLEAGIVDEVIPEDNRRLLPLFDTEASLNGNFASWLGALDLIMAWTQGSPGDFLSKAPGIQAGGARPCVIQADPGKSEPLSRVFFRQTAEILGESSSLRIEEWSRLPLTGASKEGGTKIVIHPGSGSEAKRWPLRNFLKIIEELDGKEIAGALVTGEAEENMAAAIEKTGLPLNWTWIRCPSILALARLLSAADFYLGNDSGATHLAAACGAEVVALFRSEYASAWRPLGRVKLLNAASMNQISLESVRKNIFSAMKI